LDGAGAGAGFFATFTVSGERGETVTPRPARLPVSDAAAIVRVFSRAPSCRPVFVGLRGITPRGMFPPGQNAILTTMEAGILVLCPKVHFHSRRSQRLRSIDAFQCCLYSGITHRSLGFGFLEKFSMAVKSIQLGQVWRKDENGQDYLVTKLYNEVFTQYAVLRPAEVNAPDAPTVRVKVAKTTEGSVLPGFTFTQDGSF
jgi:hypothetical protein